MPLHVLTRPNAYFDSVTLMQVSGALAALPGVEAAAAVMATELNRRYLAEAGLLAPDAERASPNDLVIAVRAASPELLQSALAHVDQLLARPGAAPASAAELAPRSITAAVRRAPAARLAAISVPGPYAAAEARQALAAGLHVFLFSDNVPLDEEVALKREAELRGLLLMGPECGTAILDGLGLGFANAIRRGDVGLVGASGTGLQEVSVLLHRLGLGVSHALGTGGRDLSARVGGLMTRLAIRFLADDQATRTIVLVSKPPSEAVAHQALSWLAESGKPAIACFLTRSLSALAGPVEARAAAPARPVAVSSLEEAAWLAAGLPDPPAELPQDLLRLAQAEAARLAPGQQIISGLFSGGSLAEEAALVLGDTIPARIVDLGAPEFTLGRPHPMIDPTLRIERLRKEAEDPQVAVILLDVVLGYAAHPDPAGVLAPAIARAKALAANHGRHLAVVAHVCGTEADPQNLDAQQAALRAAGVLLADTNAMAARLAAAIATGHSQP